MSKNINNSNKGMEKAEVWVMALVFSLIILSSSVLLVAFDKEFVIKNTEIEEGKEDEAGKVVDYIRGDSEELPGIIFNEREIAHMKDVKNIFSFTKGILVFSALSFIVFLFYKIFCSKNGNSALELTYNILIKGAVISVALSILLVFMGLNFNWFFDFFHKIFFKDGSWVFYEDDLLVNIFTFGFFKTAFLRIIFVLFMVSSITIGVSVAIKQAFFRNV